MNLKNKPMYEQTLLEVSHLIKSNQLEEVTTVTNGTRKVTLKLKTGGSITFYGEEAKQVLILTSRY